MKPPKFIASAAALVIALVSAACAGAPPASPTLGPTASPEPTATIATPSPTETAATLATPLLEFIGASATTVGGLPTTTYVFSVTNWLDYNSHAATLFVTATDLPGCTEHNVTQTATPSRAVLDFHDAASGQLLDSFCELLSPAQLDRVRFDLPRSQAPPGVVYVALRDRLTGAITRSLTAPVTVAAAPSPTAPAATATPTLSPEAWSDLAQVSTGRYGALSLVIDGSGIAHAAVEKGRRIAYLTNARGQWTEELVTDAGSQDRYYTTGYARPSIALLPNGALRIDFVNYESSREGIGYSEDPLFITGRSGQWSVPAPPHADDVGPVTEYDVVFRIVDAVGRVHLAHFESGWDGGDLVDCELVESTNLRYSTNATGQWTTEDIGSGGWSVIAVGSDRRARILIVEDHHCARERTGQQVEGMRYAVAGTETGSFTVEAVPWPDAGDSDVPRMFLDGNVPHLLIERATWSDDHGYQSDIFHQARGDGGWSEPELVLPGMRLLASVAGDRGWVHLVLVGDGGTIWYATGRGGQFETTLLPVYQAAAAVVALDQQGRPHLLLRVGEDRTAELFYASKLGD